MELGHGPLVCAGSTSLGSGDDLVSSTMFFRLNDNWGVRATHYFNAENGRLQEQFYTIYRDLRSWTARVDVSGDGQRQRIEGFTIAFSFSLKASPNSTLGDDAVMPYHLVGE